MKDANFKKDTDAVVGVVVAILLVGLFLAIILVIQTVYIPNIMEQREAEHMEEVAYQFSMLKYAMDVQSLSGQSTPISTSIVLGSKELPFLSSARSFGYLDVSSDTCNVTVSNASTSDYFLCGSIKYSSINSYYLDQSLIFETGALIANQSQGNAMATRPPMAANYVARLNITWNLINVIATGGKTSVSGYGIYPVQTQFYRSNLTIMQSIQTITIDTVYRTAWTNFLNSTLTQAGLNPGTDFTITQAVGNVVITFLIPNADLYLNDIDIKAQIAPGWVE